MHSPQLPTNVYHLVFGIHPLLGQGSIASGVMARPLARSLTGAEAAQKAADKAEKSSKVPGRQAARLDTPENSSEDVIVPGTPPLASEAEGTPEAQVQPPASTASARIEEGPRKRRRVANKLYRDSQYEL